VPGTGSRTLTYFNPTATVTITTIPQPAGPSHGGGPGGGSQPGGGKPKLPDVNGGYTGYPPAEVLYSGRAKWDYHHRYFVKSVELHAYYCDALGHVLDAKTPDKLMPLEYFVVKAKVHVAEVVTASPNGNDRHFHHPAELWLNVTGPGSWTKLLKRYSPTGPEIVGGDTTKSVHLTGLKSDREVTLGVWIVRNVSSAGWDRPFKDFPLRVAYRWSNDWGDGASFDGEHFVRVCRALPVLVSEPVGDLIKLKAYLLWRDTLDYVVGRTYMRFKLVGPRTIELPDAKLDAEGRTVVEGEVGDLTVPIGGADFILRAVAPHGFVDPVLVRASQLAVVVYERGPESVKLKLIRLDDLAPVEGRLALVTGGGNYTKVCDGQGFAEWRRGELGLRGPYRLYAAGRAGGVNRIYVAGPYAKILLEANPPVPGQPLKLYEKLKSAMEKVVKSMEVNVDHAGRIGRPSASEGGRAGPPVFTPASGKGASTYCWVGVDGKVHCSEAPPNPGEEVRPLVGHGRAYECWVGEDGKVHCGSMGPGVQLPWPRHPWPGGNSTGGPGPPIGLRPLGG